MKIRIMLFLVILFLILTVCSPRMVLAESLDCKAVILPEQPTELDEVKVQVSFLFRTDPPHVTDFGSLSREGDSFSATVTILIPREDQVVLQIVHRDNFTYNFGRLTPGDYDFKIYVRTFHGSSQVWLEETMNFKVVTSEVMPEFSTSVIFLTLLILSSASIVFFKKTFKRR